MRKFILVSVLAIACGGTELEGRLYTADEVYPPTPASAQLVDTVQWRNEKIEFWDTRPGTDAPGILTTRTGRVSEGDIVDLLQKDADHVVTPAEIWRAVTARNDVPEVLELAHLRTAELEGRPAAYQDFDMTTQQKAFVFTSMFPFIDNTHCWANAQTFTEPTGVEIGIPDTYVCSANNPQGVPIKDFVRESQVTLSSACSSVSGSKNLISVGAYKGSAAFPSQIAQTCYDSGSTPFVWGCLDTVTVGFLGYSTSQFAVDGFTKKLAIGLHEGVRPSDLPANVHNSLTYGAARLLGSAPRSATDSHCQ